MVSKLIDKEDLKSKLNDAGGQLVVVEFFATWCKPCKLAGPKLEKLANEFPSIRFFKVDVDECEEVAMEYEISVMPTFVFIKNKKVLLSQTGCDFDRVKEIIMEHQ